MFQLLANLPAHRVNKPGFCGDETSLFIMNKLLPLHYQTAL